MSPLPNPARGSAAAVLDRRKVYSPTVFGGTVRGSSRSPAGLLLIGFGAGAGILNLVLLVAGLAGMLYPTAFVVLLAAPLVLFWREAAEVFTDFRGLQKAWGKATSVLDPLTDKVVANWPIPGGGSPETDSSTPRRAGAAPP